MAAGGIPDAGTVEPARVTKIDEFGIHYYFPDTKAGWNDYDRAVKAVRKGMKELPDFEALIGDKIRSRDRVNVVLRTILPDANGAIIPYDADAYELPDGAHSFDIVMSPSERITTTFVVTPFGRDPRVILPATFETTLFHEFGHMRGYRRTLLPDAGIDYGAGPETGSDAIKMMNDAMRIYDFRWLSPYQRDALDHGLHPPSE
ncbi:hypothetical protein XI06_38810 [Bradyrhizobium sp. CCBAU 11434]|uniref:hypothetical protein n=1 Tax=Bradyrhizobium sp. CCBAU 11434 TaxID=1630885 RepID=UPI0023058B4E|nr:hypothetical protein [Bradyrhizobium sp. CCBAU 11434]MDA9526131.1 hypothetical protein [Bradyrhizobium sp. CCBAU 11434]